MENMRPGRRREQGKWMPKNGEDGSMGNAEDREDETREKMRARKTLEDEKHETSEKTRI